ncbi:MAG: TetR-family regulatory protein [Pseudonocardiales bacterium]|nr:TetR-family regulatory protein [Pseudonocardiales bacterium]
MSAPIQRNTTRHREAAAASRAETRRRLLESAAREFAAGGYTAATVTRIAAGAGVTVQTLYLAWGSKRALLRAYMESALAGRSEASYEDERPQMIDTALDRAEGDPRAMIKQISHLYRQIAERAALGWLLYRDAAGSDTAIAEDWQALQRLRHETFSALIARLPSKTLRPGLTRAKAADTAWAIASPETYELLVRTGGYTLDQYEKWVTITLTAALLNPAPSATRSKDGRGQ